MPFQTANGIAFHTQVLGSKEAALPPVVMLHGLVLGSLTTWYFGAAPVLARSHSVLLYDLRGHGKSERALVGYDLGTMAEDLRALLAGFSARPVVLVGFSYGAAVALRFALDHPERVCRLVLVESPLPAENLDALESFVGKKWDEKFDALPAVFRRTLLQSKRARNRFVDGCRFLADKTSLIADLRSSVAMSEAAIANLSLPVLLVYGAHSLCRPVGERLEQLMPSAQLALIEGGHFLPAENSALLTRHIVDFVDG